MKHSKQVANFAIVILAIVSGILSITTTFAQNTTTPKKTTSSSRGIGEIADHQILIGGDLELGFPRGQFYTASDSTHWGLGGAFRIGWQPLKWIPIAIGMDLGGWRFKTIDKTKTLTADITANGTLIDRLEIPLRFVFTNGNFNGHIFLRIAAPIPWVTPYVEGIGGFNQFITKTTVYDETSTHYLTTDPDHKLLDKKQANSWTWCYGYAAGIQFKFYEEASSKESSGGEMGLNLRVAFLTGGKATYYTSNQIEKWNIEFNGTQSEYNQQKSNGTLSGDKFNAVNPETPKKSTTDMMLIDIGLFFKL